MLLKLSSKGQLVLPKKFRENLHLKRGDQLHAHIMDGQIILKPVQVDVIHHLHGILTGIDLLTLLEEEHRKEMDNERKIFA